MMKFRRILCVLASVVFVGATLAGCALFTKDVPAYNRQIVARVGADIAITKKQLIDGFNSFGYQYVSQGGMSMAEAYDRTLDTIIDREIAARISAEMFGYGGTRAEGAKGQFYIEKDGEKVYLANNNEAKAARKASFEYVERQLRSFEQEIREQKDWKDNRGPEATPPEAAAEGYQKYIVRTAAGYALNMQKYSVPPADEFVYENNDDFIDAILMPRGAVSDLEQTIATQTFNKYVRYLEAGEKGLGYLYDDRNPDKAAEYKRAAVTRELERIQIEDEKNSLVRRLEECFELGLVQGIERWTGEITDGEKHVTRTARDYNDLVELRRAGRFVDFEWEVQQNNQVYVNDLAQMATEDFRDKVRSARVRYDQKYDPEDGYTAKLLDDLANIYFVPRHIADRFFTVSHILLGYSQEQKDELAKINSKYATDKNKQNRDNAIEVLRGKVRVTPKTDGGEPMTAAQVLEYVQREVGPYNVNKSLERKAKDFREMIKLFNSDPGMEDPEFEYVIGADMRTDKAANSAEADDNSRMVAEFTAAARKLFNYNYDEKRGGLMRVQDYVREFGQDKNVFGAFEIVKNDLIDTRGTMSGLVWTEFGAHIIMYTRNISDFVFTNTAELIGSNLDNFLHAAQTSYGDKTYFDAAVDRLTRPAYGRYEKQLLDDYKGKIDEIKYYKSKYKDLTKSK